MDEIQVSISVSIEQIHNAIIGAFEGGSTAWLNTATLVSDFSKPAGNLVWWGHRQVFEAPFEIRVEFDDPEGDGEEVKTFTNADLARAIKLMAEHSPRHLANMLSENDDAETHDVFMQYLVLGEIVYG